MCLFLKLRNQNQFTSQNKSGNRNRLWKWRMGDWFQSPIVENSKYTTINIIIFSKFTLNKKKKNIYIYKGPIFKPKFFALKLHPTECHHSQTSSWLSNQPSFLSFLVHQLWSTVGCQFRLGLGCLDFILPWFCLRLIHLGFTFISSPMVTVLI